MAASSNTMPNNPSPNGFTNAEHQALLEKLWVSRSELLTEQKDVKDRKRRKNRADLETDRHFEAGKKPSNAPSRERSSAANTNRLQLGGDFGHTQPEMSNEIEDLRAFLRNDPLVQRLSDDNKSRLLKLNMDFIAAAQDRNVVPLLLKVPKSALNSPSALIHIPIGELTADAASERRDATTKRVREHRASLSPEEKKAQQEKDAQRKRLSRQRLKGASVT